jgi:hypothetical protein
LIKPNGFFADQICQIGKYAGISDKLTSFGIFNYYPDSKTVHDCTPEIRRSMLTMVYLTSGRIDLATFAPQTLFWRPFFMN